MRDLARSGSFRRRSSKRKRFYIILAFLIVSGVGLYFVGGDVRSSGQSGPTMVSNAPPDLTPVSLADQEDITTGGVPLKSETAAMKDLRGEGAKATVTRSYGGGAYRLNVNATLPDPKNVNYAVWLVDDDVPILIDYMRGKGTSWNLGLSGTESKYLGYDGVLITLERTKDNKTEERIMSGSF